MPPLSAGSSAEMNKHYRGLSEQHKKNKAIRNPPFFDGQGTFGPVG